MRGNVPFQVVLVLLAALAILGLSAGPANAAVVTVVGVTGHDGGNWPATLGHLSDMVNGLDPTIIPTADTNPGMDTSADPADPSTWTYAGNSWPQEWKANSRLDATDPNISNAKIGWAALDLGSSTASLDKMYLWNVRSQYNTENVDTFNVYYSSGVGIDTLPAMPNSKSTTGDYDFSSGDWTLLNVGGALTLPQNTSNNNTPQLAVDLGGISAQYIGLEILTAGNGTDPGRVGLAQVEITRSVTSMAWLGGVGNWSNAAKWDSGLLTDVDATIDVAGSEVTVDLAASANRVFVGENNASSLVISDGNSLTVADTLSTGITVGASGSMTVDGTLTATVLNTSGAVTVNSTADMSGVGIINVNDAGSVTVNGASLGDANVSSGTVSGSGALTLGNVDLGGGSLSAGGLLTVDSLNLAGGAVDLGVGANNLKVNNTLTMAVGSLDMTAANMGSLDVSTAAVAIQGGTLKTDEALTAASLTYDSGVLDLGGNDLTVGSLTANDNLDLSTSTVSASAAVTVKNATLTVGHAIATETLTLDGASIVGGTATASVKYSLTNVGEYSADITGASAELVIGEDYSQDHQVTLTGVNQYGGGTTIYRGVLEVDPNAANLGAGRLTFRATHGTPYGDIRSKPTVLQTSGVFERQLGAANGLYFNQTGGFAARGGDLTVTLLRADGNASAPLLVSYPYNSENGMGGPIQLGSPTADSVVELTNDLLVNSYHLDLRLNDNPDSSTDISLISGDISNPDPNHLFIFARSGAGTLWLTGNNTGFQKYSLGGGDQAVIRAVDGVGLSPTALLQFADGVFESSGTFTREIGSTNGNGVDPGKVYFGNHGGFSAYGGKLTVLLTPDGGLAGDQLTWASSTTGFNDKSLYLGSPTADNVVELTNPIDGGNGKRNIYVSGNPDLDADYAVLSGELTNFNELHVRGTSKPGELRIAADVTATNVYVETGAALGGTGTITGNLTVQATGIVAPGAGVGQLNVSGNTTLTDDSIYEWQVGQPGETDVLDITGGSLNLDNFILRILDANGYVASNTDELPVFTYSGLTPDMAGFNNDPANFDTSELGGAWTIGVLSLTDGGSGIIYLTGLSGGGPDVFPGDADGDGDVDAADYIVLKTNMGTPSGAVLADGDFDGDGDVDWADLQILQGNYGATSAAAGGTIPEPATLGLLAFGAMAVLRRRRTA